MKGEIKNSVYSKSPKPLHHVAGYLAQKAGRAISQMGSDLTGSKAFELKNSKGDQAKDREALEERKALLKDKISRYGKSSLTEKERKEFVNIKYKEYLDSMYTDNYSWAHTSPSSAEDAAIRKFYDDERENRVNKMLRQNEAFDRLKRIKKIRREKNGKSKFLGLFSDNFSDVLIDTGKGAVVGGVAGSVIGATHKLSQNTLNQIRYNRSRGYKWNNNISKGMLKGIGRNTAITAAVGAGAGAMIGAAASIKHERSKTQDKRLANNYRKFRSSLLEQKAESLGGAGKLSPEDKRELEEIHLKNGRAKAFKENSFSDLQSERDRMLREAARAKIRKEKAENYKEIKEDAKQMGNDVVKWTKDTAKSVKKVFTRDKNNPLTVKKAITGTKEFAKEKYESIKKNIADTEKKVKSLRAKIDSGNASLTDKLNYRTQLTKLRQLKIQLGITVAQLGAGASAAVVPVTAPAAGVFAGGLAGLSKTALATAAIRASSEKGNKRIVRKLKAGKRLTQLQKFRVWQAGRLKSKQ